MLATDPTLWPAIEQAAAIARRELSSEELLDLFLDRIATVDRRVNAVCTLDVDRARQRCRDLDDATTRGESSGPLHGLPITVKDAIETGSIPSTGGATVLRDHVPAFDAEAVRRLIAAGAVVFGKTNLPEWSGDYQSFNDLFGTTNNPWDLRRTPGGSSGGAAAAVACGMTAFELGTDIGGSVRVPSAFCGVFGHKPTFGIVPTLGYLDEVGGGSTVSDINTFGPIARSADDLTMLLDVLAGPGPAESAGWRLELPRSAPRSLRGLRVAAWFDEPSIPTETAVLDVLHAVVGAIESAGARVDVAARPVMDVEAAWKLGARLIGAAVSLSDDTDSGLTHRQWLRMHRDRQRLCDAWARLFDDFDVVLCPVTSLTAFEHAQDLPWWDRHITVDGRIERYALLEAWPAVVGAAYLPSTVVPVGFTPAGLPVGVQVVSPMFGDHRSIAVGGLIADVAGGYRPPPPAVRS